MVDASNLARRNKVSSLSSTGIRVFLPRTLPLPSETEHRSSQEYSFRFAREITNPGERTSRRWPASKQRSKMFIEIGSIEREVYSSGLWPSSLAVEERNGAALSAWAVGSPVLTRHISYLNPPTRCISLGPVRFLRRGKISNGPLVYAAATYEFSYLAEITFG